MMYGISTKTGIVLVALGALGAAMAGCGSPADTTSTTGTTDSGGAGGTGGSGGGTGGTATGGGGTGGTATGGGGTGGTAAAPEFVKQLDAAKFEFAEGLFVSKGVAYVGLAALGKVIKIDVADGTVSDFGAIPPIPMNAGFMLGIVVDAAGNALVGFGGGPGVDVKNGVYKIPAAGGSVADPFASDPEMNFPNGLVIDADKNLFVADSGGAIFKIKSDGTVTKWTADPLLLGTDMTCMYAAPFPIGGNGIVILDGAFYVANTNLGSIVKIPIKADGTAGTAALFSGPDCEALGGIDGLAVDADGKSLLAVLNSQQKLVRIDPTGKISDVFVGAPLDNPASIVVEKDAASATAYITNSSFFNMTMPTPGLLAYKLQ
jgi:sugar lactone lactonase YvrE